MESKRKIPLKNYYLFGVLILITVLVSGYVLYYNVELKNYNLSKFILDGYIDQVSESELEDYVRENGTIVVYSCKLDSHECRKFEKNFIKMIKNYDLYEKVVYLNLGEDGENIGPIFKLYKDREIADSLDFTSEDKKDLKQIIDFMKKNEIIEND